MYFSAPYEYLYSVQRGWMPFFMVQSNNTTSSLCRPTWFNDSILSSAHQSSSDDDDHLMINRDDSHVLNHMVT